MSEGDTPHVMAGERVSDAQGRELGTPRGLHDDGFFVTPRDDIESLSVEHARAGHDVGAVELVWRCADCGEVGDLDERPETGPNCGAPRVALSSRTEA